MLRLTITTVFVICALVVVAGVASASTIGQYDYYDTLHNQPGSDGVQYDLFLMTPDASGLWRYEYDLTNCSYTSNIVSWTWNYNGQSGDVMGVALDAGDTYWDQGTDTSPYPVAPSTSLPHGSYTLSTEIYQFSADAPLTGTGQYVTATTDQSSVVQMEVVTSTIGFDDGTTISNIPVWIPSSSVASPAVPEPGSIVALLSGLVSLAGMVRRRKA